jgi:mannose-6-phosphate isomerase-like protein (cupin superfamily)
MALQSAIHPGGPMSTARESYSISMGVKHGFLELIDVDRIRHEVREKWSNQTLCRVNDSVVRLGVLKGEFHWHKHDREDEFFFVVDGRLLIDLQDGRTFELKPNQGLTVPKGVVHRTRAPERAAILMFESATVTPTGDP